MRRVVTVMGAALTLSSIYLPWIGDRVPINGDQLIFEAMKVGAGAGVNREFLGGSLALSGIVALMLLAAALCSERLVARWSGLGGFFCLLPCIVLVISGLKARSPDPDIGAKAGFSVLEVLGIGFWICAAGGVLIMMSRLVELRPEGASDED